MELDAPQKTTAAPTPPARRILYCHCAYAQVVPKAVKEQVLRNLADSGVAFDAVADLCEMSARRDPSLAQLAGGGGDVRIAACYPRAVRWLFAAADVPLTAAGIRVVNMRTETAEQATAAILGDGPPTEDRETASGNGMTPMTQASPTTPITREPTP